MFRHQRQQFTRLIQVRAVQLQLHPVPVLAAQALFRRVPVCRRPLQQLHPRVSAQVFQAVHHRAHRV